MEGLSAEVVVFFFLAGVAVVGACGVAFATHIVYSALSLMLSFLGVAGLYVMLDADFVAGVQLLVYVGGVVVLTLFAVMLTQGIRDVKVSNRSAGRGFGLLTVVAVFALLWRSFQAAQWHRPVEYLAAESSTAAVGNALLGRYVLPFEVASLVLLAVLVGAVVLTRKETAESE